MTLLAMMRKRRSGRARHATVAVSNHCRPRPHVIAARGEGRTFLLDTKHDRYVGLDDVGAAVWSGLEAGRPVAAIVAGLVAEYDAPADTIERDVRVFLGSLAERDLVEVA